MSHILAMKRRPMIPWSSVLSMNMSSRSSERPTHYENLEVKPKATQSEIKSAYFKLTMQYHPDKNSTGEAKVKFRAITEAYEVLGNYNKRKQYDRGLQIRTPGYRYKTDDEMPNAPEVNIEKEAARAHSEILRKAGGGGDRVKFDFDNWTEQHYGRLFEKKKKQQRDLEFFTNARAENAQFHITTKAEVTALIFSFFIIFAAFGGFHFVFRNDFDLPQSPVESVNVDKDENIKKSTNI